MMSVGSTYHIPVSLAKALGVFHEYRVQVMYDVYHFAAQPVVIILDDYLRWFGLRPCCPFEPGLSR